MKPEDEQGEAGERMLVERRRESRVSWADPRVVSTIVFGVIATFFSVLTFAGVVIGIYVVMQTRSATSEVSTASLSQQIAIINSKLDTLGAKVDASNNQGIELKGKTEQNTADIAHLNQWKDAQEFKNASNEGKFAELKTQIANLSAQTK